MGAPLTPATLNTIRLNAKKGVPPLIIAETLGWSLPKLERVARDRQIDLHLRVYASHPDREPMTAHEAEHPTHRHSGARYIGRTEQVQVRLFPADVRALDAAAHGASLRRAPALARLVENARARGLLEELVRLPAPMPDAGGEGT